MTDKQALLDAIAILKRFGYLSPVLYKKLYNRIQKVKT